MFLGKYISLLAIFLCLLAYLFGSISSAILISRVGKLPDPRRHGSKNPGATNVYRLSGPGPALCVLFFDLGKGLLPVYAGFLLGMNPLALGCIAVTACLGHMYPIFFHFSGGKGVATALGCMIPLDWGILVGILGTWLMVYKAFRYASLAALITVCIAPALTYWLKSDYVYAVSMLSALIIWQHRTNISRLLQGTEPKT